MGALLLALLIGQDDPAKDWRHPWHGATEGSRLTWKVTSEMFGSKFEVTRTDTVAKVGDHDVTVKREEGENTSDQVIHTGRPSELEGTWTRVGEEKIKVGDKEYACTIHELRREAKPVVQTTRVWTCAGAPFWALKQTWSQTMDGKEAAGAVEEVTAVDQAVKVGDREFKCIVLRRKTAMATVETVETMWRTADVPGGVARRTTENLMGGKKTGTSVEELTGFEKK